MEKFEILKLRLCKGLFNCIASDYILAIVKNTKHILEPPVLAEILDDSYVMKFKDYIRGNGLKFQIDNCVLLPKDLRFVDGRVSRIPLKGKYVRKFDNFYSDSRTVKYNSVEYESLYTGPVPDEIKLNGPKVLNNLNPLEYTEIAVFCARGDRRCLADIAERIRKRYYLPFSAISFPCVSRSEFDICTSNKDFSNSVSESTTFIKNVDFDVKCDEFSTYSMYPLVCLPVKEAPIMPYRIQKRVFSRGIQEVSFEQLLSSYIKDPYEVRSDIGLVNDSGLFYEPDIAIISQKSPHVHIDIEIDEPYSVNDEPIHYIECDSDHKRNKYFIDNGWIVIRFSERQIALYPKGCLKVIEDVLSSIDSSYLPEEISLIEQIVPESHWSLEEVRQMIVANERSKYLGIDITPKSVPNISGETFQIQYLTESEQIVRNELKSRKASDLHMDKAQELSFVPQTVKEMSWWRRILHYFLVMLKR